MIILALVSSLFSFVLSIKICDYIYPIEMNRLYMNIGMYSLKTYVSLYLFFQKIYKYKSYFTGNVVEGINVLCIKNGQVLKETSLYDIKLCPAFFEYYDMVLCKEPLTDSEEYKYNYFRLTSESCMDNLPYQSNFSFLDIHILNNGEKYNIDFGNNNFYVEGNILFDKPFLQWYLKQYHHVELAEDYTCNIMDDNIAFITLDSNSHIYIQKHNYIIVSEEVATNASEEDKVVASEEDKADEADEVAEVIASATEAVEADKVSSDSEISDLEIINEANESDIDLEENNYSTMSKLRQFFYTIENTIY